MKKVLYLVSLAFFISCKTQRPPISIRMENSDSDYTIAFGSCDNQRLQNKLWPYIYANSPSVWIWGGDNVYSDTNNMSVLESNYKKQKEDPDYQQFIKNKLVLGTWDDHDYGLNDGGEEYIHKKESQQLLLDFLGTSKNAPERNREGVYNAKDITIDGHKIKIIILDTRYFRTALTKDPSGQKRFIPNTYGQGTVLGAEQWDWLTKELNNSDAQFNVIMSSIQILSDKHGFECWGNFPHEIDKLQKVITTSKAKGVFLISGDRHIAEFSSKEVAGLPYPLIDFTSSGLTHTYTGLKQEENPYRKGDVIKALNFGLLKFNFKDNTVTMEIRGEENKLLAKYQQQYPK